MAKERVISKDDSICVKFLQLHSTLLSIKFSVGLLSPIYRWVSFSSMIYGRDWTTIGEMSWGECFLILKPQLFPTHSLHVCSALGATSSVYHSVLKGKSRGTYLITANLLSTIPGVSSWFCPATVDRRASL